ncbi:hypothetical protein I4U23_015530 [Adineta vaga]|nr:hypothetical protein I4U23_015530 [Adineta vaga]
MCRVEFKYFYKTQTIQISFHKSFQPIDLALNVHVRVNTSIKPSSGKSYDMENVIQFTCDNTDECDREFFFDHIYWVMNNNFTELTNAIQPIIQSPEKMSQCVVGYGKNITTTTCRSCAWIYSVVSKHNERMCHDGKKDRVELSIVTDIILSREYQYKRKNSTEDNRKNSISKMDKIVQYWCKPHWCTNETVVQYINGIIDEHYNWLPFYRAINMDNDMTSNKSSSISFSESTLVATQTTYLNSTSINIETHHTSSNIVTKEPAIITRTTTVILPSIVSTSSTIISSTKEEATIDNANGNDSKSLYVMVHLMLLSIVLLMFLSRSF